METWLRITVVTLTVGGGFAGVASIIQALYNSREQGTAAAYIAFVLYFALYAYVTTSGLLLVHSPKLSRPIALALALQIPRISSPWLAYQLTSGADAFFAIRQPEQEGNFFHMDFGFYFGSRWAFALFQENRWSFGINFLALALFIFVLRSRTTTTVDLDKRNVRTEIEPSVLPT